MSSIVVLPAPFGPTTARSSPLAMAMRQAVDRLEAVEAAVHVLQVELGLACHRATPPARAAAAAPRARRRRRKPLDQPQHALRQEDRHQDEHRAQHEEPGVGQRRRQPALRRRDDQRPERRADQRAPPAQRHPDHDLDRVGRRELARVDDPDLRHVERAGDPGEHRRDGEDEELVVLDPVAEEPRPALGVAHRHQHLAVLRGGDRPPEQQRPPRAPAPTARRAPPASCPPTG